MPEQFSFPGLEPPPQPTDSVFFALLPEGGAAVHAARLTRRLRDEYRLQGRPRPTDHLHISLHGLGTFAGVPGGIIAVANRIAASIATRPFDVVLDRVMSFRGGEGGRALVLLGEEEGAELKKFRQALGTAIAKIMPRYRPDPAFNPHVTLLYDTEGVDEQAVEPITWTVREFVLVHSMVGLTRYNLLARWPLRG